MGNISEHDTCITFIQVGLAHVVAQENTDVENIGEKSQKFTSSSLSTSAREINMSEDSPTAGSFINKHNITLKI